MAGPFALSGNQGQDIQQVNLQGGFTPTPANLSDSAQDIQAVENLGNAIESLGKANLKRQETQATQQVAQEVKSIRTALLAQKSPVLAQELFTEEALQDPYVMSVFKNFNLIRDQAAQGVLSHEYALERMDAVISQAVNRRPQFAEAIRTAANDAAGANVSAKLYTQIMQVDPRQKAQRDLEIEAMKVGVDVDTYVAAARQRFFMQQQSEEINHRKQLGTYTTNDVAAKVRLGNSMIISDVSEAVLTATQNGGVVDTDQLKAMVRSNYSTLRTDLAVGAETVDPSVFNGHIATLQAEEERLLSMIDDGSYVTLSNNTREIFKAEVHNGLMDKHPELIAMMDVMGRGDAALKAVGLWQRYQQAPEQLQGLFEREDGGTLQMAEFISQMTESRLALEGKVQPTSATGKARTGYLAAQRLALDTKPDAKTAVQPQEAKRLVDFITESGEDYSTITFINQDVAAGISQYKEVQGQVINYFNDTSAGLQTKYQALKAQGLFTDDDVTVENGVLSIRTDNTARTGEVASVAAFQRQMQDVIRMGQVYKANGVFPDSVFSTGQRLLNEIKEVKLEQSNDVGAEDSVINVTVNPDGSFVWGNE